LPTAATPDEVAQSSPPAAELRVIERDGHHGRMAGEDFLRHFCEFGLMQSGQKTKKLIPP